MGYFSGSGPGDDFYDTHCMRCRHDRGGTCPVWQAHKKFNYEECNNQSSILHMLIPKFEDRCNMFIAAEPEKENG